jgi:hypothetical protein
MKLLAGVLSILLLTMALPARAFVIGPYTFESTAPIDAVTQVAGTLWDQSVNGYIDGHDSHGFVYSFDQLVASPTDVVVQLGATDATSEMVFEARFVDNMLINGPGADLVLFDAGVEGLNGYEVAIGTANGFTDYRSYPSSLAIDTGVANAYWWRNAQHVWLVWLTTYAIEIDLSDFGIVEGGGVSVFRFSGSQGADPLGAAAIHTTANTVATRATSWGAVKALYR